MSFSVRRVREEKKPNKLGQYLRVAVKVATSVLRCQEHAEASEHHEEEKRSRRRSLQRTLAILVAGLIVILILIGTLKVLVRLKTIALGMSSMIGTTVQADEHGFTNIVLLGEGDSDHEGKDLTDTIIIASLDPNTTKSAVLLSIPRDTYILKTEKMGKGRINSLYRDYKQELLRKKGAEKVTVTEASLEAMRQLGREIGMLVDLHIHGVVKVNFSGFEQGVDAIGGLDIDVPTDIVDTEYPGPNYSYQTFSIQKGLQHMNGETALKYARTRHSTSDFSRSARQQQIIAAAGAKMKSKGIIGNAAHLSDVLGILSSNVESTLSLRELLGIASIGKAIRADRIVNVQLNDQNGLYGSLVQAGGFLYAPPREQFEGAAVLLPVSIPETPVTWDQIRLLSKMLFVRRDLFLMPASIIVLNAGAKEGSARKLGGELIRYLFNVVATRNIGPKGSTLYDASFIVVNPALAAANDDRERAIATIASATARFLASVLKMDVVETVDPMVFKTEPATIAIVLGKEYRYSAFKQSMTKAQ